MLIYGHKGIATPLDTILQQIKVDTNGKYFNKIVHRGQNIAVQCPSHKDGQERKPSCYIYIGEDSATEYGQVHCFTCGYVSSFASMVGMCLQKDEEFGKSWLLENFQNVFVENDEILDEISFDTAKKSFKSFSFLNQYDYYHPYTDYRGISREVVDKFWIGYDKKRNAITFPMWDEKNRLIDVTARSVLTKHFWIPEHIEKPVYLLNYCINEHISDRVFVCESQLNALRLWTWGYPAVALIGTGAPHQYNILNKCGIRSFITCFDGDEAGVKGRKKFHEKIKTTILVADIIFPDGKDVCDLTKEEFDKLLSKI